MKLENDSLKQENGILEKVNDSLKQENLSQKDKNGRLEQKNSNFKLENDRLKQENSSSQIENDSFKIENDSLKMENGRLKTENDSFKTENDNLKTENDSLKTENILNKKPQQPEDSLSETLNMKSDLRKLIEIIQENQKNLKKASAPEIVKKSIPKLHFNAVITTGEDGLVNFSVTILKGDIIQDYEKLLVFKGEGVNRNWLKLMLLKS